jgi:dihydrofolate synthase/folylpolyglutamate synthase
MLRASGFRTGLYTSPHLVSFSERIQMDGRPLPEAFLEEVAASLRSPIIRNQPSFFEATTVLALTAFARAEVDVAVLEVGLGGRLDAVNVVEPTLTAITRIGLDHQKELGPTRAAIAREKAGILRPGVPAFTTAVDPEALDVLAEEALSLGLPLTVIKNPVGETQLGPDGGRTRVQVQTRIWGTLEVETPLAGRHQIENVTLAVKSLEGLPPRLLPTRQGILEGAASVRVPGRLDVRKRPAGGVLLLDVAHNEDGMAALCQTLMTSTLPRPWVGIVGILADKAVVPMVSQLASVLDQVVLTVPPGAPPARAWDPEAVMAAVLEGEGKGAMADAAPRRGELRVISSLPDAMAAADQIAGSGGTVLVTGSFFTVGGAIRMLDG